MTSTGSLLDGGGSYLDDSITKISSRPEASQQWGAKRRRRVATPSCQLPTAAAAATASPFVGSCAVNTLPVVFSSPTLDVAPLNSGSMGQFFGDVSALEGTLGGAGPFGATTGGLSHWLTSTAAAVSAAARASLR